MTTVLVVDDSLMDRRLAGGLIEKNADFTVIYAENGKDALDKIELHLPDLVLTDLQMPEMDGLELIQTAQANYPLIPVIMMTSKGSEETAVQALKAGAASYVPKHRLAADLLDTISLVHSASVDDRSQSRLLLHRMVKNECFFELENDLTLIPSLVSYLQQTIKNMGVCDESERLRIGVALEEVMLNAIYHGNLEVSSKLREQDYEKYSELAKQRAEQEPYRNRRVYIESRVTPDEAMYVVRDQGPGFDPSLIPDPTDPANLYRPYGRGLLLMQTFMDEIRFNEVGNEVTLIKRRADHLSAKE